MTMQTILEQLTGEKMIELLLDWLEETSADFAEDRKRCADAVEILRTANLTPSVDDEMAAIHKQAFSNLLFWVFWVSRLIWITTSTLSKGRLWMLILMCFCVRLLQGDCRSMNARKLCGRSFIRCSLLSNG